MGFGQSGALLFSLVTAAPAAKPLDIYWIDVEGGAATLIVTPAHESVLIDAGNAGGRDAQRIHKVATEAAGLERIDHLILTHFHRDHFGGVAELVRLMPVGTLHERYLARAPEAERTQPELAPYKSVVVQRRAIVKPGERLPLGQAPGAARVGLEILGANAEFVPAPSAATNSACRKQTSLEPDPSDNRMSIVSLLTFGPFRFFDGGDLTWAAEADLVCPNDRVGGPVDVFQIEHHGVDNSNNPVLLRTLRPAVVVVNNGPRTGGEAGTFATLKSMTTIRAVYQLHRSLRVPDGNTAPERIANEEEDCAGAFIKASVTRGDARTPSGCPRRAAGRPTRRAGRDSSPPAVVQVGAWGPALLKLPRR